MLTRHVLACPGYFKLASLVQYVPLPVRPRTRHGISDSPASGDLQEQRLRTCRSQQSAPAVLHRAGIGGLPAGDELRRPALAQAVDFIT